jgi:hypothetical protein
MTKGTAKNSANARSVGKRKIGKYRAKGFFIFSSDFFVDF